MDATALQERFDFGLSLIEEASALALGHFQRLDTLTVTTKGHQDMASEADVNIEVLIRDRLRKRFPRDGFLGEETGRDELKMENCIWVVDPIDGTQPFISGMTGWCVSIALVADGVLGNLDEAALIQTRPMIPFEIRRDALCSASLFGPASIFSIPPHTMTAVQTAMPRPIAIATSVPIMRVTGASASRAPDGTASTPRAGAAPMSHRSVAGRPAMSER